MSDKTWRRRPGRRWVAVLAALALAACGGDGEEESTTSQVATTTSAAAVAETTEGTAAVAQETPAEDTEPGEATPTTTTADQPAGEVEVVIPPYQVVSEGEPLVAVVEPGLYSPVALENLVYDIVEKHSPAAAVVVDDAEVAEWAAADEELDEVQQSQLRARTLLRIESGVQVTFYGPYADLPGITVGS